MKAVRCAVYTRKSSEDGLEQDFNSLDAQREACAAYVLSQASEGWVLIGESYDDGGLSGGTLERPALQRLLGDVAAGLVDIIVIYKLDRLTRSLLDFAKLVETLDGTGTSFVSVTQSFNTTTSMGRLTLNMLLSFAQFEREVTAERIRDKIAASKAKGMWMGGIPPLGYRPQGRTLVVDAEQAELVRSIYARYLSCGNVRLLAEGLIAEGIKAPKRRTASGRAFGGAPFSRGQLYAILRHAIYTGRIAHHGQLHEGQHEAIIETELWEAVQRQLAGKVRGARHGDRPTGSVLAGRIVDEAGEPLIAAHARKGERRYRYYVSKALHERGREHASGAMRIPASEVEQVAAQELATLLGDPLGLVSEAALELAPSEAAPLLARCAALQEELSQGRHGLLSSLIQQVRVGAGGIEIEIAVPALAAALQLGPSPTSPTHLTRRSSLRLTRTGRAVRLVHDNGAAATADGVDLTLIRLIVQARGWWQQMNQHNLEASQPCACIGQIVAGERKR